MSGSLTTAAERRLAAGHWLLSAAANPERAKLEWTTYGVALLRCGSIFTAVRIPADLVHAAAGTEDRARVAEFLTEALDGGPVFYDRGGQQFYALVPASAARTWQLKAAECLGGNDFLGVPVTDLTQPEPGHPVHWVVPMDGPGTLCATVDVGRLVLAGQWAVERNEEAER